MRVLANGNVSRAGAGEEAGAEGAVTNSSGAASSVRDRRVPDSLLRFSEELNEESVPSEPRLAVLCRNVSDNLPFFSPAPRQYKVSVHTLNEFVRGNNTPSYKHKRIHYIQISLEGRRDDFGSPR